MGFYGSLKAAWKKAVAKYTFDNVGKSVTKYTFAKVYKEAWITSAKSIVNSFHPKVRKSKVAPASLYCPSEMVTKDTAKVIDDQSKVLQVLESALSSTTKKKFKLTYDDVKDDELYNVWSKLNELKLDGGEEMQDLEPTSKCQQCATADSS